MSGSTWPGKLHPFFFSLSLGLIVPAAAKAAYLNPANPQALAVLQQKLAAGDPGSQAVMAQALRYGLGMLSDQPRSLKLMQAAAQAKHPLGLFLLCEAADDGYGMKPSHNQAIGLCQQALPGLKALAARQDANAQFALGYMSLQGLGTKKDNKLALAQFTTAAQQGHPYAQLYLGEMYLKGEGIKQDDQTASTWYGKAADQNFLAAHLRLGRLFLEGLFRETDYKHSQDLCSHPELGASYSSSGGDPKASQTWFQRAAQNGHAEAQYQLAIYSFHPYESKAQATSYLGWIEKAAAQDCVAAQISAGIFYNSPDATSFPQAQQLGFKWFYRAALLGNPFAMGTVGRYYKSGYGDIAPDPVAAMPWLIKAAEKGDNDAILELGKSYKDGVGTHKNLQQAFRLFLKFAQSDNQSAFLAQAEIAPMYLNGEGTAKNPQEAFKWFRKLAEVGYPDAKYQLWLMYRDGVGVAQDRKRGLVWLKKGVHDTVAAKAEVELAKLYLKGEDVPKNPQEARKLLLKAIALFDTSPETCPPEAFYQLGLIYRDGIGVPKDLAQAKNYFKQAAKAGYPGAQKQLETIK